MFTGSGIPMRFADTDGSLIDVYQAATQMTDESDDRPIRRTSPRCSTARSAPRATTASFTANMHTDTPTHAGADAIVAAGAGARRAGRSRRAQMLDWLDGRNNSPFSGVGYAGGSLRFRIAPGGAGARGLEAMVPAAAARGGLARPDPRRPGRGAGRAHVKGIEYAVFAAAAGRYVATYGPDAAALTPEPRTTASGVLTGRAGSTGARRARLLGRRVRAARNGKVKLRVRCPQRRVALPHHGPHPQGPQGPDPPAHGQRQAGRDQEGHAASDAQRPRAPGPRAFHEGRRAPHHPHGRHHEQHEKDRIRLLAPRR